MLVKKRLPNFHTWKGDVDEAVCLRCSLQLTSTYHFDRCIRYLHHNPPRFYFTFVVG